ncbi:MAG: TRAM domain-containing protein [Deltaproteobacteria bacterium]|nr:TRAM domain-containing protein [Deltaproteobacteria bacterium]
MALSKTISAIILASCVLFGGLIGLVLYSSIELILLIILVLLLFGVGIIKLLSIWLRSDVFKIIGGVFGTLIGLILAMILTWNLSSVLENPEIASLLTGLLTIVFALAGLQLGSSKTREFREKIGKQDSNTNKIVGVLDTSVIIDGRIADICETGFLDGDLIIPQFVLQELQVIADSGESTKRTRGRRGLDILNKMKKQAFVKIIISDSDYPSIKEVDQKLIQMAKEVGCSIITNDFNLNKVAEVHSIQVLNINQLANALKPIVLPGETMKVQVIKEGKEPGQGIAYLDDGTMVVIDNGKIFMGKNIDATVTSVLQTTAGRMIFATFKTA